MKLMVSYNCGISYVEEMRDEEVESLLARAKEMQLDERLLRWVIESDDEGEIYAVSDIHRAQIATIVAARAQRGEGDD